MSNLFEEKRGLSLLFLILTAIEIYWFSSIPGRMIGTGMAWTSILYHFSVFFLFGFFMIVVIIGKDKINRKQLLLIVMISLLYAASDEFHQSFVSGRSTTLEDFLTDSAGIFSSVIVYSFAKKNNSLIS